MAVSGKIIVQLFELQVDLDAAFHKTLCLLEKITDRQVMVTQIWKAFSQWEKREPTTNTVFVAND